jgi:hypothetical protein
LSDQEWEVGLRRFVIEGLEIRPSRFNISGPYRWGAQSAPTVSIYLTNIDVPTERLVFFLVSDRESPSLHSSMLLLIDEIGPTLILKTLANDEG